ncbi:hypothetical protein KXX61_003879, partial [Aspergillus fumigatus]
MSAENQGGKMVKTGFAKMVKTGFAEKSRIRGLVELRSRFFNSGREKVWHNRKILVGSWVRRDQDKSGGMVVR